MLLIPQVLFFLIGYEIRYRMFHFQFSFHNMSEQFVAFNAANRAKKLYFKNKQSVGWRDGVRRRRSVELRRCVAGGIIFSKIFLRLQRSGRSDRSWCERCWRYVFEVKCSLLPATQGNAKILEYMFGLHKVRRDFRHYLWFLYGENQMKLVANQ